MSEIKRVTGTGVPLLLDEVDTDRIIPARYLRCVTFEGLGEHAFEDDRKQDPGHPFDDERYASGSVLVAGRNFGCGSSREHAPQALLRWGIRAIVAESFAEIFFGNCTSLGVPCVTASRGELEGLAASIQNDPTLELVVDLEKKTLRTDGREVPVEIPESARHALVTGQYDFLAQLLDAKAQVASTASELPYVSEFA